MMTDAVTTTWTEQYIGRISGAVSVARQAEKSIPLPKPPAETTRMFAPEEVRSLRPIKTAAEVAAVYNRDQFRSGTIYKQSDQAFFFPRNTDRAILNGASVSRVTADMVCSLAMGIAAATTVSRSLSLASRAASASSRRLIDSS
jgi:hypothetical protein